MTCSSKTLKRARPLLGTIVEIGVIPSTTESFAHEIIHRAFDSIELIHSLMSRFDPCSEVSQLNEMRIGEQMGVSTHVMRVMRTAFDVEQATLGAFTITPSAPRDILGSTALAIVASDSIKRIGMGSIDFGGIAKGYAVDEAIRVLKSSDIRTGYVNAGGDVRAFGEPHSVLVRNPEKLGESVVSIDLVDRALATSANYSIDQNTDQSGIILDKLKEKPVSSRASASVIARSCMVADALAKAVLIGRSKMSSVLERYDARGLVVQGGRIDTYPN